MTQTTRNGWATGVAMFAAALLMTLGTLQVLSAFGALAADDLYVSGRHYTYEFDLTTWGWIHLIIGVGMVLTGAFLIRGATWARVLGMLAAIASLIANFLWLPYYPWWSIIAIALNVAIIWALSVFEPA